MGVPKQNRRYPLSLGLARSVAGALMKQDESYFVDIEVPEAVLLSDSVVVQKLVHPNTSGAV